MSEVLARVTTRTLDLPRGPDVLHRIRVTRDWFEAGVTVEFEVPRNLCCAACEGGGCDTCERSGAITLRERAEPPELLMVSLPTRKTEDDLGGVVIRIPGQGGLPKEIGLPRGLLLLRVDTAELADATVIRVAKPEARPSLAREVLRSLRIPEPSRTQTRWLVGFALLLFLTGLALLAFRRLRG